MVNKRQTRPANPHPIPEVPVIPEVPDPVETPEERQTRIILDRLDAIDRKLSNEPDRQTASVPNDLHLTNTPTQITPPRSEVIVAKEVSFVEQPLTWLGKWFKKHSN